MITAIVHAKLPPSIDLKACAEHFRNIAPGFRAVPGLIRKQFIYAEDGWAGGVYLWQSRADAEAFYTGPWLQGIRERYGMDPQIKYFHPACVTDNAVEGGRPPGAPEESENPLRMTRIASIATYPISVPRPFPVWTAQEESKAWSVILTEVKT